MTLYRDQRLWHDTVAKSRVKRWEKDLESLTGLRIEWEETGYEFSAMNLGEASKKYLRKASDVALKFPFVEGENDRRRVIMYVEIITRDVRKGLDFSCNVDKHRKNQAMVDSANFILCYYAFLRRGRQDEVEFFKFLHVDDASEYLQGRGFVQVPPDTPDEVKSEIKRNTGCFDIGETGKATEEPFFFTPGNLDLMIDSDILLDKMAKYLDRVYDLGLCLGVE